MVENSTLWLQWLYALPFLLIWLLYLRHRQQRQHQARITLQDTTEAGLTEPTSLHPLIDPLRCVGSGGCVSACPEGAVIGIIDGKANLIDPTRCIGHGACAEACPHNAISLVFGTERRGVDIPLLGEDFQTSVPGIYIAGELGGMGLIRNAVTQGQQAVEAIAADLKDDLSSANTSLGAQIGSDHRDCLDVLIIGAGPAGLAAALAAKQQGLSYQVLEQESMGGTIAHYPRGKVVMTQPVELPLVGTLRFREVSKETLMQFWQHTTDSQQLRIQTGHRVEQITSLNSNTVSTGTARAAGFQIRSVSTSAGDSHEWQAWRVLLCIGRRGTPRKLGVPGEASPHVVYRLIDPEQYRQQSVLVVGGGDSALEAALALSEQPETPVTLCYRGAAFNRARSKNRDRLDNAVRAGRIRVMMEANVARIQSGHVVIRGPDASEECVDAEAVIIAAGGILPTAFLQQVGIQVDTRYGTA